MLIAKIISFLGKTETYTYQLEELEDGIYCYQQIVVSNVPANNYTIITICDSNGNVITLVADVTITFDESCECVVYSKVYLVNGNTINLKIPKGTLKNIGVSTK